ncbi:MAG: glycoside hydrolase, partial [Flavobacteriales bacterium]
MLNIAHVFSGKLSAGSINQSNHKLVDTTFKKPIHIKFGDPYILYDRKTSTYFMYGTGGGAKAGFYTYSSSDLVNWKDEGQVYFGTRPGTWGISSFWAPEVYAVNAKYYLFYSAQSKYNLNNELENFKIGVAVADSPKGPFKDISDKPLFDFGYPV